MDLSEQAKLAEEMAGILRDLSRMECDLKGVQGTVGELTEAIKSHKKRLKEIRLALGLPVRAAKAKPEEPKERKTRSDKGTRVPHNPDCSTTNDTANAVKSTAFITEAEARATAKCDRCHALLKDCKCGADIPDASVVRYKGS